MKKFLPLIFSTLFLAATAFVACEKDEIDALNRDLEQTQQELREATASISGIEQSIATAVAAEARAREAGDNDLANTLSSQITTLRNLITAEARAREAGDTQLSSNLTAAAEALGELISANQDAAVDLGATLAAAITTLNAAITSGDNDQANSTAAAIAQLRGSIAATVSAATSAVSAEATAIRNALAAETAARLAGDTTAATALASAVMTLNNAIGVANSARERGDASLTASLTSEIAALNTAITAGNTDITAEIARIDRLITLAQQMRSVIQTSLAAAMGRIAALEGQTVSVSAASGANSSTILTIRVGSSATSITFTAGGSGTNGQDGVSITGASLGTTDSGGCRDLTFTRSAGAPIVLTDAVCDGADGTAGTSVSVSSVTRGASATIIVFSDTTSVTIPHGSDGAAGAAGAVGAAGTSITITASTAGATATTITFSDGTAVAIPHGAQGPQGPQGPAGPGGTDPTDTAGAWGNYSPAFTTQTAAFIQTRSRVITVQGVEDTPPLSATSTRSISVSAAATTASATEASISTDVNDDGDQSDIVQRTITVYTASNGLGSHTVTGTWSVLSNITPADPADQAGAWGDYSPGFTTQTAAFIQTRSRTVTVRGVADTPALSTTSTRSISVTAASTTATATEASISTDVNSDSDQLDIVQRTITVYTASNGLGSRTVTGTWSVLTNNAAPADQPDTISFGPWVQGPTSGGVSSVVTGTFSAWAPATATSTQASITQTRSRSITTNTTAVTRVDTRTYSVVVVGVADSPPPVAAPADLTRTVQVTAASSTSITQTQTREIANPAYAALDPKDLDRDGDVDIDDANAAGYTAVLSAALFGYEVSYSTASGLANEIVDAANLAAAQAIVNAKLLAAYLAS